MACAATAFGALVSYSAWRGKPNKSSGTVSRGAQFFNLKKYPKATYKGRFDGATAGGMPTQGLGDLTP